MFVSMVCVVNSELPNLGFCAFHLALIWVFVRLSLVGDTTSDTLMTQRISVCKAVSRECACNGCRTWTWRLSHTRDYSSSEKWRWRKHSWGVFFWVDCECARSERSAQS